MTVERWIPPLTILMLISAAVPALAVEVGGELALEYAAEFTESLELEFFLPPLGETELRYAFILRRPVQDLLAGEDVAYFAKRLYLKHRFPAFHLTIGRQPISWAFGSLSNPADYTLGSVKLGEEFASKYTDAVEVYIPLNWNSSLSLVTSFPEGFTTDPDKTKWGARARIGLGGYDLTVNYVREAKDLLPGVLRQRLGLTVKGDLGPFGIYGAYAYQFCGRQESLSSYLIGADYSFTLNYDTNVITQVEYLANGPGGQDLLAGSLTYPLDDFSTVSLLSVLSIADGNIMLTPRYETVLPGGYDLTVGCSFRSQQDPLLLLRLSYPF